MRKAPYTNGHSHRVAEYSLKIAESAGKTEEECERIYFAALLHDVGKIGIPVGIINKKGKLTDAEYEIVKQHPVLGARILENIKEWPYFCIGAHYHHERYDGKGYPDQLLGEKIPEIARIISVADTYDAMTSLRSYRAPIPQQKVREELVKGSGTQFDPKFAKIMLHLIDLDIEYKMIEWGEKIKDNSGTELIIDSHRSDASQGILVEDGMEITFHATSLPTARLVWHCPFLNLFGADDGKVFGENYRDYMLVRLDGECWEGNPSCIVTDSNSRSSDFVSWDDWKNRGKTGFDCTFTFERKDNIITVYTENGGVSVKATAEITDGNKVIYAAITGNQVAITNIRIKKQTN